MAGDEGMVNSAYKTHNSGSPNRKAQGSQDGVARALSAWLALCTARGGGFCVVDTRAVLAARTELTEDPSECVVAAVISTARTAQALIRRSQATARKGVGSEGLDGALAA